MRRVKLRTIKKQTNRYLEDRAKERRFERNHHARLYVITMMREVLAMYDARSVVEVPAAVVMEMQRP